MKQTGEIGPHQVPHPAYHLLSPMLLVPAGTHELPAVIQNLRPERIQTCLLNCTASQNRRSLWGIGRVDETNGILVEGTGTFGRNLVVAIAFIDDNHIRFCQPGGKAIETKKD